MEITEVRVALAGGEAADGGEVLAFASIAIDGAFVIRNIRVVDGPRGVHLAMPNRRLSDCCGRCRSRNHLTARYCNHCGGRLDEGRAFADGDGRARLHLDVAHPITPGARAMVEAAVMRAYGEAVAAADDAEMEEATHGRA